MVWKLGFWAGKTITWRFLNMDFFRKAKAREKRKTFDRKWKVTQLLCLLTYKWFCFINFFLSIFETVRNYSVEITALRKQEDLRMQVHETESLTLAKSSTAVIDVLRREFKDLRTETGEKIVRLEGSIVELSRECQQVCICIHKHKLFLIFKKYIILYACSG